MHIFVTQLKQQNKLLKEKLQKIRAQEQKMFEQNVKIQEQESSIADLKKHMDEWNQKFSDLTSEVIRAREDITCKTQPSSSYKPILPKFLKSNIKPRVAQILPRSYSSPHAEMERKRKLDSVSEIPPKMSKPMLDSIEDNICNKISENITKNISKNITNDTAKSDVQNLGCKSGLGPFLSNSIEMILKMPINSIKSRKRKMTEALDLK